MVIFGRRGLGAVDVSEFPDAERGLVIAGDDEFANTLDSSALACAAGDMNGDGLDDIAVTMHTSFQNSSPVDAVFVIFGRKTDSMVTVSELQQGIGGFVTTVDTSIASSNSIQSLAGGIDINDDGYTDLLFGIPNPGNGRIYAIFGGSDLGNLTTADLEIGQGGFVITGSQAVSKVASAGDMNRDGIGDFAVTLPVLSRVGVVFGRNDIENFSFDDCCGWASVHTPEFVANVLGRAGDFDGDGFDDLIIGDLDADVYIVRGNNIASTTSHLDTAFRFTILGAGGQKLGWSFAGNGDLNADGFDDIFVAEEPSPFASAYILFGHPQRFNDTVTDSGFVDTVDGFLIDQLDQSQLALFDAAFLHDIDLDGAHELAFTINRIHDSDVDLAILSDATAEVGIGDRSILILAFLLGFALIQCSKAV